MPAFPPVFTWRRVAPPYQILAVESGVALGAGALIGPVAVLARATIQTRFGVTFVDVVLTVAPGEPRRALTGKGVYPVHTCAAIEAGAFCAVWSVDLTVDAAEP